MTTDEQWRRLCALIGRDDLGADPRLCTLAGRKAHEDELDRALEAWTAMRDRWAVMEQLQGAGIAAGVVQTVRDQLERDPHLSRGHFQQVAHPAGYHFTVHRLPIRVNGEPPPASPHPSVGADNDHVFGEILGLSRRKIESLTAEGVLR